MIDAMTFPRYRALQAAWSRCPPVPLALARIAGSMGIKMPAVFGNRATSRRKVSSKEEIVAALAAQGMPVLGVRPNDPILDLCGY